MAYADMKFEGDYLAAEARDVTTRLDRGEKIDDIKPFKVYRQRSVARMIADRLGGAGSVLEVGCGGSLMLHEADRLGLVGHGVDLDAGALAYSRALRAAYGSKVEVSEADAFALPFADRSFDFVVSVGMIEHYSPEDQLRLVREQVRVARRFVDISVPNEGDDGCMHHIVSHHEDSHLPTDLMALAHDAGLVEGKLHGRGIFCPSFAAKGNSERYQRFIQDRFPQFWKDKFDASDIDAMIAAEATVTDDELVIFGSMHAVTGRVRSGD